MAKTLQPSITKKSSLQGGRPKSPEIHYEWWEIWLPWLNCSPHCLSACVTAIMGESKLPACSVGYSNWSFPPARCICFSVCDLQEPGWRGPRRGQLRCAMALSQGEPLSSEAVSLFCKPVWTFEVCSAGRAPWITLQCFSDGLSPPLSTKGKSFS